MDRTEAWDKAVENTGLVMRVLNRYIRPAALHGHYSREELEDHLASYAWEGMLSAVESFDETRGYQFSTYAARCIQNSLHRGYNDLLAQVGGSRRWEEKGWIPFTDSLEELRERYHRHAENPAATNQIDWESSISEDLVEPDFADAVVDRFANGQLVREVAEIIDGMPSARIQRVTRRILLEGMTQATVANQLGVARSLVSALLSEGTDYIRFQLEARGAAA